MRYVAPYWINAKITEKNGKIYYRREDLTDKEVKMASNRLEIEMLIDEINTATKMLHEVYDTLHFAHITSLVYITWENLQPPSGELVSIIFPLVHLL